MEKMSLRNLAIAFVLFGTLVSTTSAGKPGWVDAKSYAVYKRLNVLRKRQGFEPWALDRDLTRKAQGRNYDYASGKTVTIRFGEQRDMRFTFPGKRFRSTYFEDIGIDYDDGELTIVLGHWRYKPKWRYCPGRGWSYW